MKVNPLTSFHNQVQVSEASGNDEIIDLGALFSGLWRGKLTILSIVVLTTCLAGYYAYFVAIPKFRATTSIVLDSRKQQVVGMDSVLSALTGDTSVVNTEVEVLRGRTLMSQVAQELNLASDPEFNSQLRTPSLYARVKASVKDAIGLPTQTDLATNRRTNDAVVNALLAAEAVRSVPLSLVFQITIESEHADKAALIVDTIAKIYIDNQVSVKFEATDAATKWLSGRAKELQHALEASERHVQEFKSSTELVDEATLAGIDKQLKDLRARILSSEADLRAAKLQLVQLQNASDPLAQKLAANDPELNSLYDAISAGKSSEAKSEFDRVFLTIVQRAVSDNLRREAQQLILKKSEKALADTVAKQSMDLVNLQQLSREAESSRQIYEDFLARLKETSIQLGIQQPDSRVLSPAELPSVASSPRKSLILAMAMIGGLLLGAGLVLIREARRYTFREATDLAKATGLAVFGQIPTIPSKHRRQTLQYLIDKPSSAIAEAVRNLRTSILLSNIDKPPKVIVVTSALPGEGKTTISLALAQNFTAMGKKVVVVEGDMRRRVFSQYVSIKDPQAGSLKVMSKELPLEMAIQAVPSLGDVLLSGDVTDNAADILSSIAFRELVAQLRESYDVVIIDTPPVLLVPDARVVAEIGDALIFAVRWDHTQVSAVQESLKLFNLTHFKTVGFVLNNIRPDGMKRYGYGYLGKYGSYSGKAKSYYVD